MKRVYLTTKELSNDTHLSTSDYLEFQRNKALRELGYEFAKHFAKETIEYEIFHQGTYKLFTTKELLDEFRELHKHELGNATYYIRRTFSLDYNDSV